MVEAYRKAAELRDSRRNQELWLQGMYIYDAVSTALHNALRGMAKNPPPARDYAKAPYELFKKEKTEAERQLEIKREQEKAALWMESLVRQHKRA